MKIKVNTRQVVFYSTEVELTKEEVDRLKNEWEKDAKEFYDSFEEFLWENSDKVRETVYSDTPIDTDEVELRSIKIIAA